MASKRFTPEQIISKLRRSRGALGPGRKDGGRVQADRSDGADVLPVAQRVRRTATGSGQAVQGVGEGERASEEVGGGPVARQPDFKRGVLGKLLSPAKRRLAVNYVRERLGEERVSERRTCQGKISGLLRYCLDFKSLQL